MKILHDLLVLCPKRPTRSHSGLAERKKHFRAIARDLQTCGYSKNLRLHQLGGRHVLKLIKYWQEDQRLHVGTIKNRLSSLRWALRNINRAHVMHRSNSDYGLHERPLATASRAMELTPDMLLAVKGRFADRIRVSLRLQRWFGLRVEESLKIHPRQAAVFTGDEPIRVSMQGSWCKNGRARVIEIENDEQRQAVLAAVALTDFASESLIPMALTYEQYLNKFYYRVRQIKLRPHALRHRFAQEMYETLTGHPAPITSGASLDWLDEPGASEKDTDARMRVSAVLGHGRKNVTNTYLGPSRRRHHKKGEQGC